MKVFYVLASLVVAETATLVSATCGCECDDAKVAIPYIAELAGQGRACVQPPHLEGPSCQTFVCAKCGKVLECYVDTGYPALDEEICDYVLDTKQFCPDVNNLKQTFTTCHQQCNGAQGVQCYTAAEKLWKCPARIGISQCVGGAGKNNEPISADLSNFAGYKYCPKGVPTCTATGTCTGGLNAGSQTPTEQSYTCVSSPCVEHDKATITCEVEKCDSAGTCRCPA